MAKARKKAPSTSTEKGLSKKEIIAGQKKAIKFVYHGRTILINQKGNEFSLTIDKEKIPVMQIAEKGFVAAPHCPMMYHQSLLDLAKYVTDHVINMRCDFPRSNQALNAIL